MKTEFIIKNQTVLANCIEHLTALNPDKVWSVTIKKHSKKRSNNANNLYWKWASIIAQDLGYSEDNLHEAFKRNFIGEERVYDPVGKFSMLVTKSSKDLNTEDFSKFMNKVEAFAMSENIRLPQPGYYGFEETVPASIPTHTESLHAGHKSAASPSSNVIQPESKG